MWLCRRKESNKEGERCLDQFVGPWVCENIWTILPVDIEHHLSDWLAGVCAIFEFLKATVFPNCLLESTSVTNPVSFALFSTLMENLFQSSHSNHSSWLHNKDAKLAF